MQKHHPLYVRRGTKVSGPFPEGQIAQSLLLGRISVDDEISMDKNEWRPIHSRPELIPEVLKADPGDETARERLQAARRWADERRPGYEVDTPSRRAQEPYDTLEYRNHRESVYSRISKRREFALLQTLIVVLMGVGLVYLGFRYAPEPSKDEADCDAPARAGVNWSHCRMTGLQSIRSDLQGARLDSIIMSNANLFAARLNNASVKYADLSLSNLSYADLSAASLKGASLQNADLTRAILRRADLSYADLSGAKLKGVDITAAVLDHAIWSDGRVCLAGSIGECRVVSP